MKAFVALCIVCAQFLRIHGKPESVGIGAYVYEDSFGNRYGGSYKEKNGVVTHKDFINSDEVSNNGDNRGLVKNKGGSEVNGFNSRPDIFNNGQAHGQGPIPNMGFPFGGVNPYIPNFNYGLSPFSEPAGNANYNPSTPYNDIFNNFFPVYFRNLQRTLQEAFQTSIENQRLAFEAARKAFDEAPKSFAGISPNKDVSVPKGNKANSPANWSHNTQKISSFSSKTDNPNIEVVAPLTRSSSGGPGYSAVSSKSYSVSSNINGQEISHRGAETVVDDNGQVTSYRVSSK